MAEERGRSPRRVRLLRTLESPAGALALVGGAVFLLIALVRGAGGLERLELALYDSFLRRLGAGVGAAPHVVLIEVTEEDIRTLGHWPVTDGELSAALEKLAAMQPRAIGLDVYRDIEVRNSDGSSGRERLARVFLTHPSIVAVMKFGGTQPPSVRPPPFLDGTDRVAFSDILVDEDGKVRRGLLYQDDGRNLYESLALRLALSFLHGEGIAPRPDPERPDDLRLGAATFRPFRADDGGYVGADERGYQVLLDFRPEPEKFPAYRLTDLLGDRVPPPAVGGKVVLLGVTAESVPDVFYAGPSAIGGQALRLRGLLLHAHIVEQIVATAQGVRAPIRTVAGAQEVGLILLWGLLGAAAGLWTRSPWRFVLVVPAGVAALLLLGAAAFAAGWWVPVGAPALGWTLSAAGVTAYTVGLERRQRTTLMRLFRSHVSAQVAEAIWSQREEFLQGGRARPQRVTATVLFSDLRGFTTLSEGLEAAQLLDWLNQYMEAMAQEVMRHHGVIDKYIGDAIMAVFGVPIPSTTPEDVRRDAIRAVECALAMEQRLAQMNERWAQAKLPTVGMRIGIFTGPLVAGSLGAMDRVDYTVIGDTVNTASRLESLRNPEADSDQSATSCRILIGDATLALVADRFETRTVGEIALKGKSEPVRIHRVDGRRDDGHGAK